MAKIIIKYKSPDTDIPNKRFTSKKYDLKRLLFDPNPQIDFIGGSYLMLNDMEPEYTEIVVLP
jgi:hypothetical protein